jgi:hypothetical protein
MKQILLTLAVLLGLTAQTLAQGCGPANPNCIVPTAPYGTNNSQAASTAFVQQAIQGSGGGDVGGPGSSTVGDVATWNNTTGTLLADKPALQIFGTVTANNVFAGPTAGGSGFPTFRALTLADVPFLTPGGSNTQVQFNNNGAFGGDSGFTYAGSGQVTIATGSVTSSTTGLHLTQTWNNNSLLVGPFVIDVTNTSSALGSAMAQINVGGVTDFEVVHNANGQVGIGPNQASGARSVFFGSMNGGEARTGINFGSTDGWEWFSNGDGFALTSPSSFDFATGTLSFGGILNEPTVTLAGVSGGSTLVVGGTPTGSPSAQTIEPQEASGTNTVAAATFTLAGPLATGTATNGDLVFQTGVKTTSGTAAGTATTALTIKGETQQVQFAQPPQFNASTTSSGTQTFTNSPCSSLSTERWVPVSINGQSGTWYFPACQ